MNTIKFTSLKMLGLSFTAILFLSITTSCTNGEQNADAYGNFEAREILVSSESNGKLLSFNIEEGQHLKTNQPVAWVDTILPALQLEELKAQRQKIIASMANIDAQKKVLNQQKENLQIDIDRIKNMRESGASTQKQLDDVTGKLKVIIQQMDAYDTQKMAVAKELKILEAKKMLLCEQLKKCRVINPKDGLVLEKYAEQGEITAAGKPLYKIADLNQITLKAYVSGAQMYRIKVGETCKVHIDKGTNDFLEYDGEITWISSQAEFTPKIIQTKDERVNMVYAIKVLVSNDGSIKLGMPGEVYF